MSVVINFMATAVQDEEIEALRAIYDQDFFITDGAETSYSITICSDDHSLSMELYVSLPGDYPMSSPPIYQFKNSPWLDGKEKELIAESLYSIFSGNNGDVVMYQWVEWLREYINNKSEEIRALSSSNEAMTDDIGKSPSKDSITLPSFISDTGGSTPEILHGEPLTDRKSTFQAHIATVHSVEEVRAMLTSLKSTKKIAAATHNILAYRIYISANGVFQQDYDDDGEFAAGGRLLHLLQIMNAQNVAVIVTRWYGGIQLHADRFKHINNVARLLIQESGIGLEHLAGEATKIKNKRKKSKPKS